MAPALVTVVAPDEGTVIANWMTWLYPPSMLVTLVTPAAKAVNSPSAVIVPTAGLETKKQRPIGSTRPIHHRPVRQPLANDELPRLADLQGPGVGVELEPPFRARPDAHRRRRAQTGGADGDDSGAGAGRQDRPGLRDDRDRRP